MPPAEHLTLSELKGLVTDFKGPRYPPQLSKGGGSNRPRFFLFIFLIENSLLGHIPLDPPVNS